MLILTLGLAVFFSVELLRKLPVIKLWTLAGKKPWDCDTCMAFWISGIWSSIAWKCLDLGEPWLYFPASAGVALVLLLWTDSLQPPPPPNLPQ